MNRASRWEGRTLRRRVLPHLALACIAVAASGLGLRNGFTYDDFFIIVGNGLVHDLKHLWATFVMPYWPIQWGGDGYRPLTIAAFALQWAIAPDEPVVFHAMNVLLYIATGLAVFALARRFMSRGFAWLAAALFVAHPVHVEAVASAVGQAELWVAMLMLGAVVLWIDARRSGRLTRARVATIAAAYLAACLFKEHAIVLPLLLAWTDRCSREEMRRGRPLERTYLLLGAIAVGFVAIRTLVIGRVGGFVVFPPFTATQAGVVDRALTMLGVVPEWLRLLLWPARMATEYGPPGIEVAHDFSLEQLPGVLIVIGVVGLAIALRRSRPAAAFGLGWLAITLIPISNLVPSGILLAERTLFTPSVGVVLVVASLAADLLRHASASWQRIAFLAATGAVIWLGVFQSALRTTVWFSSDTLFERAVADSPASYRAHHVRGGWLAFRGDLVGAEREYVAAIGMFPKDPGLYYNLGQLYFSGEMFDRAYLMFGRADSLVPDFAGARARMATILAVQGRYEDARILAAAVAQRGGEDEPTMRAIMTAAELDAAARRQLTDRYRDRPGIPRVR